jgi:dihydroorotase-like cyclic amidohydrolase
VENLTTKLAVISRRAVIDYGLYGGVSGQTFEADARTVIESLAPHVLGFKCYFISGMETFTRVDHWQFEELLRIAGSVDRPVLLHAEDFDYVTHATEHALAAGDGPAAYHDSRPAQAEVLAVLAAAELARIAKADLHIVHVSTGRAAEIIHGTPGVTGETGPHYLAFSLSDFIELGSPLKVTPPVKPKPNREELWRALADGSLSFVASDHAPAPARQKHTGSIWTDYAGIPGSGTLLPYLFSEGYRGGRLSLQQLLAVTSGNAAVRYGIADRKGALEVGRDGDCVLVDPDAEWTVRGEQFLSKGKITPFEGMTLRGRIRKTVVRGTVVYDSERGICVQPGFGQQLRRST